jgi:hypothetical protein
MSWLYSRALVEEYSGDISLDGEQSVLSSGNPIPQAYCAPDKMMVFSRLSRFGITFKPLTEDRGETLLMSYLAAFPAKTSLPQEKAQGLTESDQECGEKWRGSFTKYDPDSSLWKTHQCSLLGDWEPFSETWPRWGLMRNGECWEQQMLAHRTSETESGLWQWWPTPTVNDSKNSTLPPSQIHHDNIPGALLRKGEKPGSQLNPMWVEWLMGWPLGWTDLKPLEMDKFQQWQEKHGRI